VGATPESIAFLETLPAQRDLVIEGRSVKVAHGAPWDDPDSSRCEYVFEKDAHLLARFSEGGHRLVLIGHTHYPMLHWVGETLVVNPGSCGEPMGEGRHPTFATLDFEAATATLHRYMGEGRVETIGQERF
jgi:predicted phosphodiesterase